MSDNEIEKLPKLFGYLVLSQIACAIVLKDLKIDPFIL